MKKRYIQTGLMSGLFLLAILRGYGDGYRNPPPTAEGIGKSGVNSVFVDDASAISYNPANLAMLTNRSYVASLTLARTEHDYSVPLPFPPGATADLKSSGDWNLLPNIYYAQPVNKKTVLGIGITSPSGQGIEWDKADFAPSVNPGNPLVPYEATLMFVDINPTASFKASDSFYFGVGLNIIYSELEIKALLANPFLVGPPVLDAKGEGDGMGYGSNFGFTWLPTENQRVTFTYRSQVQITYEGDFTVSGADAGDFETTVKFPNSVGIGYGIQLTDAIQIEALLEWLEWSVNDTQTLAAGPLVDTLENDWNDTVTVGVGGSWAATDALVLRAGYAFLPTPIPDETMTPLLPDADRHALSLGLGYTVGQHTVDLAYTFSIYDDRDTPLGSYEIDSDLIGMTYSMSF